LETENLIKTENARMSRGCCGICHLSNFSAFLKHETSRAVNYAAYILIYCYLSIKPWSCRFIHKSY